MYTKPGTLQLVMTNGPNWVHRLHCKTIHWSVIIMALVNTRVDFIIIIQSAKRSA